MASSDPRFDRHLQDAPEFARPLLHELRARVHAICPDVVESVKWRMPAFEFHGLLAGMAAFRAHCTFGFWKDRLLRSDAALAPLLDRLGRMTSVRDLPSKAAFAKVMKAAMRLNVEGIGAPRRRAAPRPELAVPPELVRALAASKRAKATFDAFAPSHRREYVQWIVEAKKDETRQRRIEQTIEWLAQGKHRNWQYERRKAAGKG